MAMCSTSNLWRAQVLLAVLAPASGCQKKKVEGYRVVGYDGSTNHWTLLRNGTFEGKYLTKRLIHICDFYKRESIRPSTARTPATFRLGG